MKKLTILSALLVLIMGLLTACGAKSQPQNTSTDNKDKPLSIVVTIFPEYDWVKEILGDNPNNAEVTILLDNGVDLHSFQPTSTDILTISSCDMFIYVGGESDEWVEDALNAAQNKDIVTINLLEVLGSNVKEEEFVEGMEEEHEDEYDEGEEEEPEYDEHVWLSLKNAAVIVDRIASSLGTIDKTNESLYRKNADAYIEKINALDKEYEDTVSSANKKVLLFGDRFPFRYMVDDYGLDYYAAFVGCSAETEASFDTIIYLANKADELSLNSIMTIEGSDHKIAETINDNSQTGNKQILSLDSMQSTTSRDAENGTTYLSIMEKNLEILKEALK